MDWSTSKDVLVWLMGAGSIALFSFLAEYWGWFQLQDPDTKKYVSNVVVSVIALVAYGVYQFVPADVFVQLDPIIKIVLTIIGSVGFKELWYRFITKKPQK